jgi:diaminopimelate epimerase
MDHEIQFTKASGAGNDFVIIDDRDGRLPRDKPRLARLLCDRHFGVGADGLLILQQSAKADFSMQYYNADGSYGGMCGNGGRCLARFAFLTGVAASPMTFDALDHVYRAEIEGESVKLGMKEPRDFRGPHDLHVGTFAAPCWFVDTGSPHVVIRRDELESIDIREIGRAIRMHPEYAPSGTNVNFIRILGDHDIEVRTYERGVEDETLACGTGSVASAFVASRLWGVISPVTVHVRSGENLVVHLEKSPDGQTATSLQGSAHMLFSGRVSYGPSGALIEADMRRTTIHR